MRIDLRLEDLLPGKLIMFSFYQNRLFYYENLAFLKISPKYHNMIADILLQNSGFLFENMQAGLHVFSS